MQIKDLINGKVTYDKYGGQYFWINEPKGGSQMLAEMRGWDIFKICLKIKKEILIWMQLLNIKMK